MECKKILSMTLLALFLILPNAFAKENIRVAVMDFGTHPNAVPIDINIFNAGKAASEYVIDGLVKSNKFDVMDRFMAEDRLKAENLNITGLIDPDTAMKIGKILDVKYIIYGNVNDVTLSSSGVDVGIGGASICTVQSHLILRMMNVETGEIICASKGEGKSRSSGTSLAVIQVGNKKVTQESVHNAIKKAAFQAVNILVERLYKK